MVSVYGHDGLCMRPDSAHREALRVVAVITEESQVAAPVPVAMTHSPHAGDIDILANVAGAFPPEATHCGGDGGFGRFSRRQMAVRPPSAATVVPVR